MNKLRFVATLSTHIELDMFTAGEEEKIFSFLEKSRELCKELKHFLILTIPAQMEGNFYSHRLYQIFFESIKSDTQSNILIYSPNKEICPIIKSVCGQFSTTLNGEDHLKETKHIVGHLLEKRFPILFDNQFRRVSKKACDECGVAYACSHQLDFEIFNTTSANIDNLKTSMNGIDRDWNKIFSNTDHINLIDIKYSCLIQAFFCNISEDKLNIIKAMDCTKEFLGDIRGCSTEDFKNISFSAFRAIAFPSSTEPTHRVENSIDWHFNEPKVKDNVDLRRSDVLERYKTGIKGSGAKRILIGFYEKKKYLLAYKPDHEFSDILISDRINKMKVYIKNPK